MPSMHYQGGCFCGRVRYEAKGAASHLCFCHCRTCSRAVGATPVAWGTFATEQFSVASGRLAEFRSTPEVVRGFCADCGTSITYRHDKRPDEIDVTLATLDDPSSLLPTDHIWVQDKPSWTNIADGRPQFATYRTDNKATL